MRSKFILMLALVMGLVTTYFFYNYMQQFDAAAAINENTIDVVAVKEPVKKNQEITKGMLKVMAVPEQGLHPNTVKTMEEAVGLYTIAAMEPNEIVLSHHLQDQQEESLFVSRKIPEGYRAVSIGLNFVQSVSNLIEPDDYVDVVFTEQLKSGNETQIKTQMLLQKKRVLAIGRKMIETKEGEEYVEYNSVTLELNPEDAVKLVNASERGNVQLVLHTRVVSSGGDRDESESGQSK